MNIYKKKESKEGKEIFRRFEFTVETIVAILISEQFWELIRYDQLDKRRNLQSKKEKGN